MTHSIKTSYFSSLIEIKHVNTNFFMYVLITLSNAINDYNAETDILRKLNGILKCTLNFPKIRNKDQ